MATTINADNGSVSGSAGLKSSADSTGVLALQTNGTTAVSVSTAQVITLTNALAEASGGTGTTVGYYGFKNRIINGAMVIDQRNAGASVTPTNGQYTLDRFAISIGGGETGKLSIQQNAGAVTPPAGFTNYLGVTSLSAYTVPTANWFTLLHQVEGFNVADLAWGTASAATITLSFWVRSSLTGTFGGALNNSGNARNYPYSYTINAANTWEQKSITIVGDTSGTWNKTNSIGIQVGFALGAGTTESGTAGAWTATRAFSATGATSVVGTNGATFYITGVQLEKGSTATSFDYRPYGTELALCQRYALKYNTDAIVYAFIGTGYATTTTNAIISLPLPFQMRAAPTVTSSTLMVQDGTTITAVTATAVVTNQTNSLNGYVQATVASGLTAFRPYQLQTNNSASGNLLLSAEL